ncbi:MAG: hypothetical protein KDA37_03610 [Planctomycetales bacterium]|nr:hypothetical protein [Planctomycetales bacterium]
MENFFTRISKQEIEEHKLSVAALVAANCVPLLGVLLLGWSTFQIVLLYWFENVVLGVVNVAKMLTCSPDAQLVQPKHDAPAEMENNPLLKHSPKLFFVPFFLVHYGIFCGVHGVFIFALLSGGGPFGNAAPVSDELSWNLLLAALAFAGSHVVSFCANYLGKGEYRRVTLPDLMQAPYPRIVVLHMAIVLGAFATIALGSPLLLLVILIVGKTLLDLKLHLKEHKAAEGQPEAPIVTTVEAE